LATSLASYNNRIENLVCNLPTQPNWSVDDCVDSLEMVSFNMYFVNK
jgi:hypothetical protein